MARWDPRRIIPALIVSGILLAVAFAAERATPGVRYHPAPPTPPTPPPVASAPAPSASVVSVSTAGAYRTLHIPAWFGTAAAVLVAVFAAVTIGVVLWFLLRGWLDGRSRRILDLGTAGATLATRREAVLDAVDASLAELARADGDARSAVIACWVRLEEVAEAAGTPRHTADTPTDLVHRLLAEHQVSGAVLTTLADLYRQARYSSSTVPESVRDQARAALGQLRDELSRSTTGALADPPLVPAGADRRPRPRPRPDRG
jgi:hypothetical protein